MLNLLEVSGCLVTIDAIGRRKRIARQFVSQDADYVFVLKENQGRLLADVKDLSSCESGLRSPWRLTAHCCNRFAISNII